MAAGVDIHCMTLPEFRQRRLQINNLAYHIARDGVVIMTQESLGYSDHEYREDSSKYGDDLLNFRDEQPQIDWTDVDDKINDGTGASSWLSAIAEAGTPHAGDDKKFGRVAQNAFDFAYKSLVGAHGVEYPTGGSNGHNLRILTDLMREHGVIESTELAPGEEHRYLTEFGRGVVYAHEHPPLNREQIADDIPQAVAQLLQMVERPRNL